jgi:hypothetical protein
MSHPHQIKIKPGWARAQTSALATGYHPVLIYGTVTLTYHWDKWIRTFTNTKDHYKFQTWADADDYDFSRKINEISLSP